LGKNKWWLLAIDEDIGIGENELGIGELEMCGGGLRGIGEGVIPRRKVSGEGAM